MEWEIYMQANLVAGNRMALGMSSPDNIKRSSPTLEFAIFAVDSPLSNSDNCTCGIL